MQGPYKFKTDSSLNIQPILAEGEVSSCAISPSLPTGLSLDETTCGISGSATETSAVTYQVTAKSKVGQVAVAMVKIDIISKQSIKYSIGGTVTGLDEEKTVVLQNELGDTLSVDTNGSFHFVTSLVNGSSYSVTVLTQPTGQTCSVTNGSGSVRQNNVTDIAIDCLPNATYTVGGAISGLLICDSLRLQNNGGDDLFLRHNDSFTFATPLENGSDYNVTISEQPERTTCTVTNERGTLHEENVTNVTVTCTARENITEDIYFAC